MQLIRQWQTSCPQSHRMSGRFFFCQITTAPIYSFCFHEIICVWQTVDFRLTRAFWRIFLNWLFFEISNIVYRFRFRFNRSALRFSYKFREIVRRFISISRNWFRNRNGFMLANFKLQKTRRIPQFSIKIHLTNPVKIWQSSANCELAFKNLQGTQGRNNAGNC